MGIINNFFGSSTVSSNIEWNNLETSEQLERIVEESAARPVIIFKHSTRCGISRMVLKQFEKEYNLQDKITPYFLDLLQNRDISNLVASRFSVMHQSPQLLLLKDGIVSYHASHSDIDAETLGKNI